MIENETQPPTYREHLSCPCSSCEQGQNARSTADVEDDAVLEQILIFFERVFERLDTNFVLQKSQMSLVICIRIRIQVN